MQFQFHQDEAVKRTKTVSIKRHLFLIDPQNDFCDIAPTVLASQGITSRPALPVTGAHQDMLRLANWLGQIGSHLHAITTTLDSHHEFDIAHPAFWKKADGSAVSPFTVISKADFEAGVYQMAQAASRQRVSDYLAQLEAQNRYQLMVWPTHCVMGTWGHQVHFAVLKALEQWQYDSQEKLAWVGKGKNAWTEHYSAIQAEVPDPLDPETQLNLDLIKQLDASDEIYVAGQASSHCVKASLEHLVEFLPSRHYSKIILLTDCMSAVTGFEKTAQAFLDNMQEKGLQLKTTTQIAKAWLAK